MRMLHPSHREDLSRFLVHLTRDSDGVSARDHLVSILRSKTIEARNAHCLFMHQFENLGFSDVLTRRFNTVCFTETPLTQIHRLTGAIPGRRIELSGYGLVFLKDALIERGVCPAVYLNAKGTGLREYLLSLFRDDFRAVKKFKTLKKAQAEHYESIIQYYSLINIIASNYDFAWEREWRHSGSFDFLYRDIVAIIAEAPDSFEPYYKKRLLKVSMHLDKIPILSPASSYEDVVQSMSLKLRKQLPTQ